MKKFLFIVSITACLFLWAGSVTGSAGAYRILSPDDAATVTAPDQFLVEFETTQGNFRIQVHRQWAPHGVDRFYYLVSNGFYDGMAFFRVVDDFVAQFGIHGDPNISRLWRSAYIPDDPVVGSNLRGTVAFALAGADSRTTQIYINLVDNAQLDSMRFAPFGEVIDGMEVVDSLYSGYGDGYVSGRAPTQNRIQEEGKTYLRENFPSLDYIIEARIP